VLEELNKGHLCLFPIRDAAYRKDYRTFLKGILTLTLKNNNGSQGKR